MFKWLKKRKEKRPGGKLAGSEEPALMGSCLPIAQPDNYNSPDEADLGEVEGTFPPYEYVPVTFEIVYNGQSQTKCLEYAEDEETVWLIGRESSSKIYANINHLLLDASDKVASRDQAKIIVKQGKLYLLDLSFYATTKLNKQPVPHEKDGGEGVQLSNGDTFTAGNHTITVRWNDEP